MRFTIVYININIHLNKFFIIIIHNKLEWE